MTEVTNSLDKLKYEPKPKPLFDKKPEQLLLLLVAWLAATGRWGSYLHLGPIFITDMVLITVWFTYIMRSLSCRSIMRSRPRPSHQRLVVLTSCRLLLVLIAVLLAWSIVRLVGGGRFSPNAIRDAAPYLYASLAFFAFRVTDAFRAFGLNWLRRGLIFHILWVAAVVVHVAPSGGIDIGTGVPLFTLRTDFDSMISGVAFLYFFYCALTKVDTRLNAILAGLSGFCVLALISRSGLVATGFAAILLIVGLRSHFERRSHRRIAFVGVVVGLVLPFLISATALSPALTRLLGTGSSAPTSLYAAGAAGTTRAREVAWTLVISYTNDKHYEVTGVGFGPDFLQDSGAAPILEGTEYVGARAPHNFLINSYARLGYLGLGLVALILVSAVRLAMRALRGQHIGELEVILALFVFAIPAAALVGVILESPFGAVPFYSALAFLRRDPLTSSEAHLPN